MTRLLVEPPLYRGLGIRLLLRKGIDLHRPFRARIACGRHERITVVDTVAGRSRHRARVAGCPGRRACVAGCPGCCARRSVVDDFEFIAEDGQRKCYY